MRSRSVTRYRRLRDRLRPVRTRLTVLATCLVSVALVIAGAIMMLLLHSVLVRSADSATEARARQIAQELTTEGIGNLDPSLLATADNVDVIQVLDSESHVRATSSPDTTDPLTRLVGPGEELTVKNVRGHPSGVEYRATVVGASSPDGPATVVVGAAEDPIDWLVVLVGLLCSIVFPVVVIGMGLLTYYFVGRTLRPVDRIRQRVEDISGGDLGQRVPVPDTGDEIATLAETMNAMLGRIETARAQQLRFVNDASHELNSPLTTLVGLLDLSRSTNQPLDTETIGSVMLPEALRLQQMVADLLLLARADESGVPLRLGDVDLDEVVSAEVARLEAVTSHTVVADIVAIRVRGDAEKLGRALRNITENAARHAHSRLTVTMTHDVEAETATVTVDDDGHGIPDEDKRRVLERFVRLDDARARNEGGSGLGLSIVAEIVRAHHGEVVIADAPGGGARVGFTLPVAAWND